MRKWLGAFGLLACLVTSSAASAVDVSFEEDASLPVVYLNVAVKAGTVNDPAGQTGMSQFVGRMLLRGTQSRNKEQIDLALDQMGARLEVETRAEALILRGAVLKTELDNFLALLAEIVASPSFPEVEIEKLKKETISQILGELNSDAASTNRKFNRFLFRDHPYGKPISGTIKEVQGFKRAQVLTQYQRLFQNRLLLVLGTGDASSKKISDWAKALGDKQDLMKLPAGIAPIEVVSTPTNAGEKRLLLVDKPERTQAQVNIGQIGVRMTDPEFFPLYVGNHSFGGGGFQTRLMQEIRVKRGWTYGAYSYFRHGRKPRSWQLSMATTGKDTAAALEYALKMIGDLKEKGITQEEFDFAKTSLINGAGFMYNTPKKRVENALLERTLDLPDGFMRTYAAEIGKLKLDDVNSALKKYYLPEKLTVTVLATAKDLKDPLAKAAGVPTGKVQVVPYTQE